VKISARNKLQGTIKEVKVGNVMAIVKVQVGENLLESVITRESVEELGLKAGDKVTAMIKATSVMIIK